jgi:hypothetical protein
MPTLTTTKKDRDVGIMWRERIRASQILHRLIKCAEGELELTHTQANTGLRLVDKILPSLQAVTIEQTVNHVGLNRYELDARMQSLGINAKAAWLAAGDNLAIESHTTIDNESESVPLEVLASCAEKPIEK